METHRRSLLSTQKKRSRKILKKKKIATRVLVLHPHPRVPHRRQPSRTDGKKLSAHAIDGKKNTKARMRSSMRFPSYRESICVSHAILVVSVYSRRQNGKQKQMKKPCYCGCPTHARRRPSSPAYRPSSTPTPPDFLFLGNCSTAAKYPTTHPRVLHVNTSSAADLFPGALPLPKPNTHNHTNTHTRNHPEQDKANRADHHSEHIKKSAILLFSDRSRV